MKKTIISLMTLVGVASAASTQSSLTLNDVNLGTLAVMDISAANLTTTTGFTIMMTLDFKNDAKAGSAMWFSTMESTAENVATTYTNSVATIGWGAPSDPKDYRLTLFTKGGSASGASTSAAAISGSTANDSSAFQTTAFVTYSGGTATMFEINSAGELLQTGSTTYSPEGTSVNSLVLGNWGHNGVNATGSADITLYSGVLTQTEMKSLLVPEPTTATLSLLALAGLAARRRRK